MTRQQEALKVARRESRGDGDDEDIRNQHTLYEINEGDLQGFVSPSQHVDSFFNNEEESARGKEKSDFTGTEVLTSKGGETIRSNVVGHKRNHDRNPMVDPSNDEPLNIIEYPDGSLYTEGYNALISALNLQLNEFGDEYYTFQAIRGHQQ